MDKKFDGKPMDPDLEATIKGVKQEFQNLVTKKKDLVLILGRAFQKTVSKPESICEEIKNTLKEEIAEKMITTRLIEQACPDEWKHRTKLKKAENEEISFSSDNCTSNLQEVVMEVNSSSMGETPASALQGAIVPSNSDNNDHKELIKGEILAQKSVTSTPTSENAELCSFLTMIWNKYKDHINLEDLAYEIERYWDFKKINHILVENTDSLVQTYRALDAKSNSLKEQNRSLEEENQRLEQDKINKMAELWKLRQTQSGGI